MNFRTLYLTVSLLLLVAFVLGATIVESNYSLNPNAWLFAQRKVELLWGVDCFALLTLVPIFGITSVQQRLAAKGQEIVTAREEHQKQLERMISSSQQMDQLNADQADQIAQLEQVTTALQQKIEASQAETRTRLDQLEAETRAKLDQLETERGEYQKLLTTEAQRLADAAFERLNLQMEAVHFAMEYQRAEIKQLRQKLPLIQESRRVFEVVHLSAEELVALNSEEATHLRNITYHDGQITDAPPEAADVANLEEQEATPTEEASDPFISSFTESSFTESSFTEDTSLFVPTINSQSTFISPPTAFAVTSPLLDPLEMEPTSKQTEEQTGKYIEEPIGKQTEEQSEQEVASEPTPPSDVATPRQSM